MTWCFFFLSLSLLLSFASINFSHVRQTGFCISFLRTFFFLCSMLRVCSNHWFDRMTIIQTYIVVLLLRCRIFSLLCPLPSLYLCLSCVHFVLGFNFLISFACSHVQSKKITKTYNVLVRHEIAMHLPWTHGNNNNNEKKRRRKEMMMAQIDVEKSLLLSKSGRDLTRVMLALYKRIPTCRYNVHLVHLQLLHHLWWTSAHRLIFSFFIHVRMENKTKTEQLQHSIVTVKCTIGQWVKHMYVSALIILRVHFI